MSDDLQTFTVNVYEEIKYTGTVRAASRAEAEEIALADVIEHGGKEPGAVLFSAVQERYALGE